MKKFLSSALCQLSTVALLSATACTQDPAPVVLRGHEDFSRNALANAPSLAALSPAAGTPSAAPVDNATVNAAGISGVSSNDLPPPQAQSAQAQPKPQPMQHAQAVQPAAKPAASKPVVLAKAEHSRVQKPYIWPVEGGKVVARFGPQGKGKANAGILISADSGEPVYAAADGQVVFAGDQLKGYGNMVLIKHKNSMLTTYAHLSRAAVARYAKVKQGDIIGYIGASGNTRQPELYFAMHKGTTPVDPQHYLSSSYAER